MSDDDKSSLRLLLENNLSDIRYTKQQQWHLIYLTLIAIAGITSLALSVKLSPCHWFRIYLLIGDVSIGITGCLFMIYYAISLEKYREEKRNLIKRLPILNPADKKSIVETIIFTTIFCLIISFSWLASVFAISMK